MLPGIGGMDPRQMSRMMKQLGIKTEDIDASEVIIKKKDGKELVIAAPQVSAIEMQGQKMLQISGDMVERESMPPEEDIALVMKESNCTRDQAIAALKKHNGDMAETILELTG